MLPAFAGRLRAAPTSPALLLGTIIIAAFALYGSVLVGLARQWLDDPNSAYGIVLTAAAVFVFRRKSRVLAALPARPHDAGFAVLIAGLVTYLAGTITGDIFLLRASIPIVLCAVVVT